MSINLVRTVTPCQGQIPDQIQGQIRGQIQDEIQIERKLKRERKQKRNRGSLREGREAPLRRSPHPLRFCFRFRFNLRLI